MKIIAFSDSHGYLPQDLPDGDILAIAGDIVPLNIQRDIEASLMWIEDTFIKWADSLNYKKIILVPGNHDFCFENMNINPFENHDKIVLLRRESYTYDGITFFGFPCVTPMRNWAFPAVEAYYSQMPEADILICHDTPSIEGSFNDEYVKRFFGRFFYNPGNEKLKNQVGKYKYVICGHWHDGVHNGVEYVRNNGEPGIQYNVSLRNDRYDIVYPITTILIDNHENQNK